MNEDLLNKTLDDMAAGIPARDAEIAALRAERDQLRIALVAVTNELDMIRIDGDYSGSTALEDWPNIVAARTALTATSDHKD